jgi:hypothetical protein
MDIESPLPLVRQNLQPSGERSSDPNPISSPAQADEVSQKPVTVQGMPQTPPAQPHQPVPVAVLPPSPAPTVDDSAAKKPPAKPKVSAGKIAAILTVILIIGGAVVAAAYFLPGWIQEAKDAENNVNKTVEYTSVVEKTSGYEIEMYNSDDVLVEIDIYDEEDSLVGSKEILYNEDGKEIGYNEYDKSGNLKEKVTYEAQS